MSIRKIDVSMEFLFLCNISYRFVDINPLNPELNPICYLLAFLAQFSPR